MTGGEAVDGHKNNVPDEEILVVAANIRQKLRRGPAKGGHGTGLEDRDMEEMNLRKMMKGLAAVDDMTWGMYAFSRDALRDKVDCGRKKRDDRKIHLLRL